MVVYTYSKARQNLSELLDACLRDGQAKIQRKDGTIFVIHPENTRRSPFDVEPVHTNVSAKEIVEFIHQGRRPAK